MAPTSSSTEGTIITTNASGQASSHESKEQTEEERTAKDAAKALAKTTEGKQQEKEDEEGGESVHEDEVAKMVGFVRLALTKVLKPVDGRAVEEIHYRLLEYSNSDNDTVVSLRTGDIITVGKTSFLIIGFGVVQHSTTKLFVHGTYVSYCYWFFFLKMSSSIVLHDFCDEL